MTYPDTHNPYTWPDPAWIQSTDNPTIITVPGSDGEAADQHLTGNFDDFIVQTVQFDATQRYWYSCAGIGTGSKTYLTSNITISRVVKQVRPNFQPCARYTVTKLDYKASFIPSQTVTCTPQPKNASQLENAYQAKKMSVADIPSESHWKIEARPVFAEFSLGEPIFVDLRVTNLNSEPASIDLGGDGKTNLRVTIAGQDGLSKPVQLPSGGLGALGKHLVGAHATYVERLILNEWKEFHEVGDYDVTVALVPQYSMKALAPPTTHLRLSLGPRNESKLGAVAKALADRAVDGRDVRDRADAALALSYMLDPIAVPEMKRVLQSRSDAALPLIAALVRLGGPSALDALQAAQSNPREWIRDAAARALQTLREGKPKAGFKAAD